MNEKNDKKYDDMSGVPVEDAMTLAEHDFRYHNNHYREGDECLYRERLAAGDESDESLNEANSIEAASYYAKINEMQLICDRFCDNFDFMRNARHRKKGGIELSATQQAKNGDRWLMIHTPRDFDDSQIDVDNVRDVCTDLGYEFKEMKVGFPQGERSEKKMFAIRMNNPNLVGAYVKNRHHGASDLKVKTSETEPLSDDQRNSALKRFGYKVGEGGKVVKRGNAVAEGESAARKYLRLVDEGGTALKNKTNAEIARERAEEKKSKEDDRIAFMKELGLI